MESPAVCVACRCWPMVGFMHSFTSSAPRSDHACDPAVCGPVKGEWQERGERGHLSIHRRVGIQSPPALRGYFRRQLPPAGAAWHPQITRRREAV